MYLGFQSYFLITKIAMLQNNPMSFTQTRMVSVAYNIILC